MDKKSTLKNNRSCCGSCTSTSLTSTVTDTATGSKNKPTTPINRSNTQTTQLLTLKAGLTAK